MKIKLNLILIVLTVLLIATAYSHNLGSSPILDQAQPERNYQILPLLPVTGEQTYGNDEYLVTHPPKQFHSACESENSLRQGRCQEEEPNGVIFFSHNANTDPPIYPSQKLHSDCISQDSQRQDKCME